MRDCWSAPRRFGQHSTAPHSTARAQLPADTARTWSHTLIMSATLRLCCGDSDTLSLVSVPSGPFRLRCAALRFPALLCSASPPSLPLRTLALHAPARVSCPCTHTVEVRKCYHAINGLDYLPGRDHDHGHEHDRNHLCESADFHLVATTLLASCDLLALPPSVHPSAPPPFFRTPIMITGNSLICDGIIPGGSGGHSTDLRARAKADCMVHPLCTLSP